MSTTHLVASDRWGNVVAYNLTIEQTGGSAITVPGRGFLLNNELTDFSFAPLYPGVPDPNLPAAGKRPRSSMAPTIVLKDGRPYMAVGSPGGATIITTVLQILTGRIDRGLPLLDAVAAPTAFATQRRRHRSGAGGARGPACGLAGARPRAEGQPGDRCGDGAGVPAARAGPGGRGADPARRRIGEGGVADGVAAGTGPRLPTP
ncbi:gamma-glutamyltransferase [Yinghuangia aomiensis]